MVRPLSQSHIELTNDVHPWRDRLAPSSVEILSPEGMSISSPRLRAFANSKFPFGGSDGAVWQGRGLTTAIDGGVVARVSGLSVAVRPTLLYTQNTSFELAVPSVNGLPEYAYPWRRIDLPQRFGPSDFWTLDPGQSEVRLDAWGGSAGLGTMNLWWGPGVRNGIVMSANAPGIPHAFLGTNGEVQTGIGGFEARWIWGRLQQSNWFDPTTTSTRRFITGIAAAYSPSFVGGLSLGFARMFYVLVPPTGVPIGDYFAVLRGVRKKALASSQTPTGDDEHDQLISFFGRWVLVDSGFEVYWEWARNDHSWSLRDFMLQPEHSQAYTLGLRKTWERSGNRLGVLTAELTHLEADPTFQLRGKGTYYAHHIVTQGYTQRGQIIGAAVGPGGNAQYLAFDVYRPSGRLGISFERHVHDNDAYYDWAAAHNQTICCNDVSFNLGGSALFFVDDFDLGGGVIVTREYNRYFYGLDLWNLNLSFSARWRPD
ncbi:MAG: capsule assembly Wzi family protein [Gemmatimonadales bacterium]